MRSENRLIIAEVGTGIYAIPPKSYGAGERTIFYLSCAMKKQGNRVIIIDFVKGFKYAEENVSGMTIFRIPFPYKIPIRISTALYYLNSLLSMLLFLPFYVKLRKKWCFQVIHFHMPLQTIAFRLFQLIVGKKEALVFTLHSPRWMDPSLFKPIEKAIAYFTDLLAVKLADLVVFESNIVRTNIVVRTRIPLSKTLVIYNGVDTQYFDPLRWGAIPDPNTVLYAARICKQKNQLEVIKAIPLVISKNPKARFLFVGPIEDKDYYLECLKKIRELGITRFVKFFPPVDIETLNRLRVRCGINLVFSRYTGFDVALGETLSLGCATIVCNIPVIREVLTHEKDCMIVNERDTVVLAKTILRLMQDENFRKYISNNARTTASYKLDWNILAYQLKLRLEELLKRDV